MLRRKSKPGFTMVELLAVMAIIGILISMLVPAVGAVRERARSLQCQSNLHNLGVAMLNYETTHQILPINWSPDRQLNTQNTKGHSWLTMILPQLENEVLFRKIKFGEKLSYKDTGTGKDNTFVAQQSIAVFRCPSDNHRGYLENQFLLSTMGSPMQLGVTNYKACAGSNWGSEVLTATGEKSVKFTKGRNAYQTDGRDRGNGIISRGGNGVLYTTATSDIKDGTSSTFAAGEAVPLWDTYSAWYGWDNATATCGIPLNYEINRQQLRGSEDQSVTLRNRRRIDCFISRHSGGGNFGMCDGGAKWISSGIDYQAYRALGTIDAEDLPGEY